MSMEVSTGAHTPQRTESESQQIQIRSLQNLAEELKAGQNQTDEINQEYNQVNAYLRYVWEYREQEKARQRQIEEQQRL